jgi:hypothetical protein
METKVMYLTILASISAFMLTFSSSAQSASGYMYALPLAAYNIPETSGFTVEAWVKAAALPGYDPRIFRLSSQCLDCPEGEDVFDVSICHYSCTTGRVTCQIRDDGTNIVPYAQSTANINDGNFHHVACTYDGNALQVYIDGNPSGSAAVIGAHDLNFSDGSMVFANSNVVSPWGCNPLDGLIDEARIWNTARSQEEIEGNMDGEISPSSSNLIGYWKLNGTYADATAGANSLTPGGTVMFETGQLGQAAHVVNGGGGVPALSWKGRGILFVLLLTTAAAVVQLRRRRLRRNEVECR